MLTGSVPALLQVVKAIIMASDMPAKKVKGDILPPNFASME